MKDFFSYFLEMVKNHWFYKHLGPKRMNFFFHLSGLDFSSFWVFFIFPPGFFHLFGRPKRNFFWSRGRPKRNFFWSRVCRIRVFLWQSRPPHLWLIFQLGFHLCPEIRILNRISYRTVPSQASGKPCG